MIVQFILNSRKGTRELESDTEDEAERVKTAEDAKAATESPKKEGDEVTEEKKSDDPEKKEEGKEDGNEVKEEKKEEEEEEKMEVDEDKEKSKEEETSEEKKENELSKPEEVKSEVEAAAEKKDDEKMDEKNDEAKSEENSEDKEKSGDKEKSEVKEISEVKEKSADKEQSEDKEHSVGEEKSEDKEKSEEKDKSEDKDTSDDKEKSEDKEKSKDLTVDKPEEKSDKKEKSPEDDSKEEKPEEKAAVTNGEVDKPSDEVKKEENGTAAEAEPVKPAEKTTPLKPKKPARTIEVEEFMVKFKSFSYLHCQWLTEEELHRGDKRIASKIKRFKLKREKNVGLLEFCQEEDAFNPDYVEVDRVLDESQLKDEVSGITTRHYLVKWRSLPYEDCTWELENDVDPNKISDFLKWREAPDEDCYEQKRPKKHLWKKWDESPAYNNGNLLRPYQLEGVNWLLFSWYNGRNCLLADEMGLGKTIQSLAFLKGAVEAGIRGPFLVIAPLSTIPNWQREFELWTSELNVIVYHGSQTSRNMLAEYEMYYKNPQGERLDNVFKFHVLITTYECVITDILELREIQWRICVIDEAHRLKNQNCKLLEGLNLLEIESRLLLSGTPLQNNINELYSLLSFLEPLQFNSQEAFMKDFGDMQNEDQVKKLQAILKPLMLRRMKEDVEKSLKAKEETIVEVELTNIQKKYYRGILEKNFSFLAKSTHANVPNLMNTMMELRKCCIHPYLLNGAEEQIQDDYKSRKSDFTDDDGLYFNALINSSGKMVLLDKLLPKLKANGHRVLVFSQMVKMLDILEDYLVRKQYPYERIDGRIRGNLRQAAIDRYCKKDSDRFVFLLCTKAGGLGINLVAADTCIIYDSDWNPQNDLQAQARCHRIGQKKAVKIYRLVTRNTYEREMFDRAGLKLGLDKAVLQSMNTGQGKNKVENTNQLTKTEIENLLKKGAYGALMDDDNAGDKFCEEDIEHILQRRTQTIEHEQEKAGGSFSKASFASADTTGDINIDDPDFWAKWAKKAEIEEIDEKTRLLIAEPRSRKQIRRFGGNESLDPREVSDLDTSSDEEDDGTGRRGKNKKGLRSSRGRRGFEDDEDYIEDERDVEYGDWPKHELFRIEKSLLAFG
jgi:chromodomain-helicase-DNA-binding protein 7